MELHHQIFWGSLFLIISLIVLVGLLAVAAPVLENVSKRIARRRMMVRVAALFSVAAVAILTALTIQIWLWAAVWVVYDVLPDWNTSIYFSLVTFTSVGYGDIVLGPETRIFGTFGAVTGMLSFGLSTAFLVTVMRDFFSDSSLD